MNHYRIPCVVLLAAALAAACTRTDDADDSALRLFVFDCGSITMDAQGVELFGLSPDETDVRELAVPCYVVEHPAGRLLWDGGLPSAIATEGGGAPEAGMGFHLERTLADQLRDMGLDMGSFDYVAFSHMHLDHVGVANELVGGTLIIQQAEYEVAFADEVTAVAFDRDLYDGLLELDALIIDGDHDVFGDGRVRIVAAPGHTPGHQLLFVDLENTGPVVLSGDLYHFRLSREDRRVPTFNVDAALTRESMQRVEALVAQTGAELWIQHERAHFDTQRKAPEYYR